METYAVAARSRPRGARAPSPEPARRESVARPGTDGGLQPLGSYLRDHVKLNGLRARSADRTRSRASRRSTSRTARRAGRGSSTRTARTADGATRSATRTGTRAWSGSLARRGPRTSPTRTRTATPRNQATERARGCSQMDFFNNEVGRAHGARLDDDRALVDALTTAITRGDLRAVRFGAGDTGTLVGTDTCTAAAPCGT